MGKREKIEFAQTVDEYGRRYKLVKRDLVLTGKALWFVGRETIKSGPGKGQSVPAVMRKIDLEMINKVETVNWTKSNVS